MNTQRFSRSIAALGAAVALLAAAASAAAAEDITNPVLDSFARQGSAAVTAPTTVSLSYAASDAGTGVDTVSGLYDTPTGGAITSGFVSGASGSLNFSISGSAPNGTYQLSSIRVIDKAGPANDVIYNRDGSIFKFNSGAIGPTSHSFNFASADFTVSNATADTTNPVLNSFARQGPAAVTAPTTVSLSYAASDAGTGVDTVSGLYDTPTGGAITSGFVSGASGSLNFSISGSAPNGTYQLSSIRVIDKAGPANDVIYNRDGSIFKFNSGAIGPTSHSFNFASADFTVGPIYHPLTPSRILSTRDNIPAGNNTKIGTAPRNVTVVGVGGVPATGVGAVVLNIAETEGTNTGQSWITAWPAGATKPNTANVNFAPGQTTGNLVIVPVGAGGQISLALGNGTAHVFADVQGWFGTAGYNALNPARILSTRDNIPAGSNTKIGTATRNVTVVGVGGVPATGVGAVVLNIAETDGTNTGQSWITAWPAGATKPNTANVNFAPGQTTGNLVIVPVGAGGQISLALGNGTAHVFADVQGWFGTAGYNALNPARILSTRDNIPAGSNTKIGTATRNVTVVGVGGVPATGVGAVVLNIAETEGTNTGQSWITAWPAGATKPNTANVNFAPGQTTGNLVIVPVGAGGQISLALGNGTAHVFADVQGWFST